MLSEAEATRFQMMPIVSDYMRAKNFNVAGLYSYLEATVAGINCDKFITCIRESYAQAGQQLSDAQSRHCQTLFKHAVPDTEFLSKDKFSNLMAFVYRAAQATTLSEGQAIASKPLRRIEEGELVKGCELPVKDDASGLCRLHCHASKDGAEGWVSVAGNKGVVFLEWYKLFQSCVKETIMTDGLATNSRPVKRLRKDDVLEVLEHPRRDVGSGLMRLRGKAVNGGNIGWVNISRGETVFLEAC